MIKVLSVLGAAALVVSSCGGESLQRDDSGAVVSGGTASVFELRVGDCLLSEEGAIVEEVLELPLVPCSEPHTHEVYAFAEHPEGPYPGAAAIEVFAEQQCVGEYADYIGVELSESLYYFTYIFPSVSTWNDESDREIVCFVVSRETLLTASVKGTNT